MKGEGGADLGDGGAVLSGVLGVRDGRRRAAPLRLRHRREHVTVVHFRLEAVRGNDLDGRVVGGDE